MIAVDIAILVPEPVKGLANKLSKELNTGDFHLNDTDILPHITLGIGFVEEVKSLKFKVQNLLNNQKPLEVVVERVEGRYLMVGKSDQLYNLHRAVCDAVDFVQTEDFAGAYFGEADDQTREFANNFKWRNAYDKYVPHITIGWEDKKSITSSTSITGTTGLPVKFTAGEVAVCQLGNKNTCRKVLGIFPLKS